MSVETWHDNHGHRDVKTSKQASYSVGVVVEEIACHQKDPGSNLVSLIDRMWCFAAAALGDNTNDKGIIWRPHNSFTANHVVIKSWPFSLDYSNINLEAKLTYLQNDWLLEQRLNNKNKITQ